MILEEFENLFAAKIVGNTRWNCCLDPTQHNISSFQTGSVTDLELINPFSLWVEVCNLDRGLSSASNPDFSLITQNHGKHTAEHRLHSMGIHLLGNVHNANLNELTESEVA